MQVESAAEQLPLPQPPQPATRSEIPDVPRVAVAIGGRNPLARAQALLEPVWDAVQASAHGKRNEADQKLRILAGSSEPAVAWAASLELGALLALGVQSRGETQLTNEGLGHLLQCLSAPFADIAASAAWNIAEILHMAGRLEAADQYAWVARDLGDATALAVSAHRATNAGQPDVANELYGAVIHAIPRWMDERSDAERGIAEFALEACPEFTRDWFTRAQGVIGRHDWSSITRYDSLGAMFNVEEGRVSVSTSSARFTTLAGYGDGVYPVFTLRQGTAVAGALTILKDAPNDLKAASASVPEGFSPLTTSGSGEFLGALLAGCAPLVIGQLQVTDCVWFSDSTRATNGRDAAVDVTLAPATYSVVAFMSLPLDDFDTVIRPLAFGVLSGTIADAIRLKTPQLSPAEVDVILTQTVNDASIRLAAQTNDVVPSLLKRNAEQALDASARLSWLLQLAEVAPTEDNFYAIYGCPAPTADEARRLLALRGFDAPALQWLNWIPGAATAPAPAPAYIDRVEPQARIETPPAAYIPPSAGTPVAPTTNAVPTAAVPTNAVPTNAVPTNAVPTSSGPKFCTSCGAKRTSDSRFCTSCGAKLG